MHHRLRCITFVLFLPLWLGACAVPKYTDVALPVASTGTLGPSAERLLVVLEPVLPGHPISETVWDNVDGPLWSPTESKKIGFTQHYQLPAAAFVPQPVRVGLFASGQASFVSSRIMVPYGRLLTSAIEIQAARFGVRAIVCSSEDCVRQTQADGGNLRRLTVRIDAAAVAETRTNRISMAARGGIEASNTGSASAREAFDVRIDDRSITDNGYFHSDFLRTMNSIAGEFSENLAKAILKSSLR